jgi:hypothetical protein
MWFSYLRDDNDDFPVMKKLITLYKLMERGNLKSYVDLQKKIIHAVSNQRTNHTLVQERAIVGRTSPHFW